MEQWKVQRLRVLIIGSQNSFEHVLAANIQRWGHEAVVLPAAELMMKRDFEEEGDVLLYDLDTSLRAFASQLEKDRYILAGRRTSATFDTPGPLGFTYTASAVIEPYLASPPFRLPGVRRRFTIAMSSHSISRIAIERFGAVALLYKPFEIGQLQRYFSILLRLLQEQAERPQSAMPVQTDGNTRPRVLVVDDDVEVARAIKRCLLVDAHYDVAVAYDGLEALEHCLDWHPHCVVTDLIMPGMNGYQVMRCLADTLCTTPGFVVMSALHQREMPLNPPYLAGKSVEYIDKPFQIDHLLTAVERACSV
ncbi:MAG TPA: response regulator [Ktedonobacteraceae bacterium]|nr:response regulator [Ktedonobacteraceae bacterium]